MPDDDYHRELADYEPGDGRPLRHPMTVRVMRIVVVLGLIGLVLPGILVTVSTQISTAETACGILVAQSAPDSVASEPRFEMLGAEGPGWYCYARQFDGSEILLTFIGLIPGGRFAPAGTPA